MALSAGRPAFTTAERRSDRRRVRGRRSAAAAAAIGATALLAAACGSSSSSPTTTTSGGSSGTSTGATTSGSSLSSGSSPVVGVAHSGSTGLILVDRAGKTLYRYTPDGTGKTTCTGGCASIWPPLTVPAGTKVTGASSIPASELGTVTGSNGTMVVTFKGMPLYTYTGDTQTGQTNGQGVGGVWFIVPVASSQSASGGGSSTTSSSTASGYGY